MSSTSAAADLQEIGAQLDAILSRARSQAGDDPFTAWQQVAVHVGHAISYLSLLPNGADIGKDRVPAATGARTAEIVGDVDVANSPQGLRARVRAVIDALDLPAELGDIQAHHRRSLLLALGRADEVLDVLDRTSGHAPNPSPTGPAAA